MTPKKYEHLGKAVMIAAELAMKLEKLNDLRGRLDAELCAIMPRETADAIIRGIMSEWCPSFKIGSIVAVIADNAKEIEK